MLFKNITMIDPKIQAKEKMNIGIEEDNIVYIGEDVPEKDQFISFSGVLSGCLIGVLLGVWAGYYGG